MKKSTQFLLIALSMISIAPLVSAEGKAAAGEGKAAACVACHGAGGNSASDMFPKLAGQSAKYLEKQLQDIRGAVNANGQRTQARAVPEMTGMLNNFSDQDLQDIAAYYAGQKSTLAGAKKDAVLLEKGTRIYRAGNPETGVAACAGCHSPTGSGNAPAGFPTLGGQHAAYIEKQLKAFRTAADEPEKGRANDGESRTMRDVAAHMSDLEIRAVANYISGLH